MSEDDESKKQRDSLGIITEENHSIKKVPSINDTKLVPTKVQSPKLKKFLAKTHEQIHCIVNNYLYMGNMAICTFYLMFADDIRILCIPKRLDVVFMSLNIVSWFLYIIDICFSCVAVPKYIFGFYFWLDFIAMISIISDITWIWNPLTGVSYLPVFTT